MSGANPVRGEAALLVGGVVHMVRPSFAALVAAESELGPLLALVDRAAEGRLLLAEMIALLWHCLAERPAAMSREAFGEAMVAGGIGAMLPALRAVMRQSLTGGQ